MILQGYGNSSDSAARVGEMVTLQFRVEQASTSTH